MWKFLKSPKTIAILKLGVAVVGVFHAIDEFRSLSKSEKKLKSKV